MIATNDPYIKSVLKEFRDKFGNFNYFTPDIVTIQNGNSFNQKDVEAFINQALLTQREEYKKRIALLKTRNIEIDDQVFNYALEAALKAIDGEHVPAI